MSGTDRCRRIGVLGGAFDPIHIGHLALASHALERERLDEVLFAVAEEPIHKRCEASAPDRLNMVRTALGGDQRFRCCDIEFSMPKPVYALDMLLLLKERMPEAALVYILGGDAAAGLGCWYGADRLQKLVRIAAFSRSGAEFPDSALTESCHEFYTAELPAISSSEIRARLHAGESAEKLLPPGVLAYIREHGLYASSD